MIRRPFYDEGERDLISAYEEGEFRPVADHERAKLTAVEAAWRYLRKDRAGGAQPP